MQAQADKTRADVLADALDHISEYAFVDGSGMATHGPMGAEALATLGSTDQVAPWVEQYKQRHDPIAAPPIVDRLDPAERSSWVPALGDPARLSDWNELFSRQLEEQPWPDVVATWAPALLSGYGGAFTHGLIRTAHAVRAVESGTTPSRPLVGELAKALAYWAGSYKALPGRPTLQGHLSLQEAIAQLPRPTESWSPMEAGQFTRIHELRDFPTRSRRWDRRRRSIPL